MTVKLKGVLIVFVIAMVSLFPALKADAYDSEYVVKLKDCVVPDELAELLCEVNSGHCVYTTTDIEKVENYGEYIEYVETNEDIMLIDGDGEINLLSIPDDALYYEQYQTQMVNAEFAWDMETYGNEVNVAVIDSGCNPHDDINLAGGYNFVQNNDDYSDNHGHGTHVSGIISALHNKIGIAGIAPKVNLYALKCMDPSYSTGAAEVAAAIYAAVDKYNCKVINMSLGVKEDKNVLHEAVKYATDKGVIVVAAVGNDGDKVYKHQKYYPASYDEVIGVGSVSKEKKRSSYSQQNSSVFVVAPGESYLSISRDNWYEYRTGTSQASPIVAASAAILLSADPDMTVEEFKNYIIDCSESLTDEYCGHGLLNIKDMFKECIKDTDYYISPLNSDGVVVYNNTESSLAAVGIFTEYDDERYSSSSINDITNLSAYERVKINHVNDDKTTKFFLWSGMDKMEPLSKEKKREVVN